MDDTLRNRPSLHKSRRIAPVRSPRSLSGLSSQPRHISWAIGHLFNPGHLSQSQRTRSANILANVRDHRWLPVARLLPKRSEAESAGGVTRVAIRWIALLAFLLFSPFFQAALDDLVDLFK